MSSLTRRNTLAASVLAAVRGKTNGSMEEERPEDLEAEDEENKASSDEDDTAAEGQPSDGDEDAPENQEDGDGDPEDEPQASGSNRVRRAEQNRIRTILTHPKAQANPGLANELAFGAKFYPAADAVALMESSAGAGGRLADRMQGRSPQLGAGASAGAGNPSERQAVVARVGSVIKAMHGRKQKET